MEQKIGETTTQLVTGDSPLVDAFRACVKIRAFCREAGISRAEENEAVRAVWIEFTPEEHTEPQRQWAATMLEHYRKRWREHHEAKRVQADETEVGGDESGEPPPKTPHSSPGGSDDADL